MPGYCEDGGYGVSERAQRHRSQHLARDTIIARRLWIRQTGPAAA